MFVVYIQRSLGFCQMVITYLKELGNRIIGQEKKMQDKPDGGNKGKKGKGGKSKGGTKESCHDNDNNDQ